MEGTGRNDIMRKRVLDYQITGADEKIETFAKRIQEQIRCIRIGENSDALNYPSKAENYAKKCERFLMLPYFTDKKYSGKSVAIMKDDIKVQVGYRKEVIAILNMWYEKKRDRKLAFVEVSAALYRNAVEKKKGTISREKEKMYLADISFLQEKIDTLSATRTVLKSLLGILLNKDFMLWLGAKTSWKVSTLKSEIGYNLPEDTTENRFDEFEGKDFGISYELLQSLLELKYFKYKKYLEMEVRDLIRTVNIDLAIVEKVLEWLDHMLAVATEKLKIIKKAPATEDIRAEISRVIFLFNDDINVLTEEIKKFEKEYSLYRFGQGLLENDIFDSLYV